MYLFNYITRVSFGGGGGICPALALACLSLDISGGGYKSFNDTMNGNLCLCEKVRFHQIASNKRFKVKFSGGACPRTPLVCHMLCTQIRTCPPNNPYNLILPPLGKKLKETLITMLTDCLCTPTGVSILCLCCCCCDNFAGFGIQYTRSCWLADLCHCHCHVGGGSSDC